MRNSLRGPYCKNHSRINKSCSSYLIEIVVTNQLFFIFLLRPTQVAHGYDDATSPSSDS